MSMTKLFRGLALVGLIVPLVSMSADVPAAAPTPSENSSGCSPRTMCAMSCRHRAHRAASASRSELMISAVPSENGGAKVTPIRDTSAQDRPIDPQPRQSRRRYLVHRGGRGWRCCCSSCSGCSSVAGCRPRSRFRCERVRIAEVTRGPFIRDVSAQGTVVAAVSPTLFAPATGTVHFLVQAGDVVKKGQVIAKVDSPELRNELAARTSDAGRSRSRRAAPEHRHASPTARESAGERSRQCEHPGRRARAATRRRFLEQAPDQRARLREGARRCRRGRGQSQARDRDGGAAEGKSASSSCARASSSAIGSAWSSRICSVASTISTSSRRSMASSARSRSPNAPRSRRMPRS